MKRIQICCGKKCTEKGSQELEKKGKEILRTKGLEEKISIESCGCLKKCEFGPNITIMEGGMKVLKTNVQSHLLEKIMGDAAKLSSGEAQKKLNSFLSGKF